MAFSFGTTTAAGSMAPSPAAGGWMGSTATAASAGGSTLPTTEPIANVPPYDTIFPNLTTRSAVLTHLTGRELIHLLSSTNEGPGTLLAHPQGWLQKPPMEDVRFKDALVHCANTATTNGSIPQVCILLHDKEASITPSIARDVLCLSTDLHLSLVDSLSLYAEANRRTIRGGGENTPTEDDLVESFIQSSGIDLPRRKGSSKATNVMQTARQLYFRERASLLQTIFDLIRYRIQASEDISTTTTSSSNSILVATDQLLLNGLVSNLIATIRELNDSSRELRRGLNIAMDDKQRTNTITENSLDMECALLGFTLMQRQLASECLFYLAYHTQLTAEEVSSIIDLIRDLTNGKESEMDEGLPLLDPVMNDVPNPYEEDAMATFQWQQYGAWNKPVPLQSKDATLWKEELISNLWARGQPQLLQCVTTLIMSVTCALDAKHVLLDRTRHGPNVFGNGNALLPPISGDAMPSSLGDLQPIHSRLDPDSQDVEKQWKRRDIWGLLLIPYALLLRNSVGPELFSPSRGSGSSRPSPTRSPPVRVGQMNVKMTCTKCLMVASQLKSLTFARMSLIPSFGTSSISKLEKQEGMDSSIIDFYVSVFADFTSQFIDALCATGNLPITRKEWYDEESNLAQTEWAEKEQRRQFGVWAGQTVEEDTSGPREVNIMDRPDCLEDIFALVSSICSTHPEGSKAFWKIVEREDCNEEGNPSNIVVRLAPSRFLERLDLIHADSDSLLFVYLSFLSSLALAEGTDKDESTNGASTVHSYLSGDRTINPHSERHVPFGWVNIINAIRWYAEQLSPDDGEDSKKNSVRKTSSSVDISEPSTSYYYGVSDNASSNTSTSPDERRPTSPDDSKRKGLDEVGTNTLTALLCLISNVAAKSSMAREYILGIQLPVPNNNSSNDVYQESSLEILFSLLTTPISTDIQGMVFMAIANLLQSTRHKAISTPEDTSKSQIGKRAWELLEMIQLLPIKLLENGTLNPATATMSSFAAHGRNQTSKNTLPLSVFPPSADYGLMYQFEHVEAEAGSYPSTEGFLYLLTTLIRTVGCPSDLGSQWRLRQGCLPYVEFVTNFVLPRATGLMKNITPLPFATVADECRLISRALECIEAVLVRYVVPLSIDSFEFDKFKAEYLSFLNVAKNDIGVALVPEILREAESLEAVEIRDAIQDFKNIYLNSQGNTVTGASQTQQLNPSTNQIPLPKTPGFFIMANLLSFGKSPLFSIIHQILSQRGGSSGVQKCREEMASNSVATALFRETPPTIDSSKRCADFTSKQQRNQIDEVSYEASISSVKQSMIVALNPTLLLPCSENSYKKYSDHKSACSIDATLWKERTILLSLRILASTAIREDAFTQMIQNKNLSIVPTLSFKGPIHGSFAHRLFEEEKVYCAKLSSILTKVAVTADHQEILPLITECVGYSSYSLNDSQQIAKNAFCIVSYIAQTFPQSQSVRFLSGDDTVTNRLISACSDGLLLRANEEMKVASIQSAILDLILSNVRGDCSSESNLSLTVLGVTGTNSNYKVLNAIMELISNVNYVLDPATSSAAAKCFEIIYRLMQIGSEKIPPTLLSPQFWHSQVTRYLAMQDSTTPSILHEIANSFASHNSDNFDVSKRNNDVLHTIAWILKGIALELFALVDGRGHLKSGHVISAQSLVSLLGTLFSQPHSLLLTALVDLPLGQSNNIFLQNTLNTLTPTQDALKGTSIPLQGPSDVCGRFEVIDMTKLSSYFGLEQDSAKEVTLSWATAWNSFVQRACACSHLSNAWSDLCRTATIVSHAMDSSMVGRPFINTRVMTEMLCTILLRLNAPDYLGQLGMHSVSEAIMSGDIIESESATSLSVAVLCLTDFLHRDLLDNTETSEYVITDEDVSRICTMLQGSISTCVNRTSLPSNDEGVKILKCALSQMHSIYEVDASTIVDSSN